jgi:hypothetical protein
MSGRGGSDIAGSMPFALFSAAASSGCTRFTFEFFDPHIDFDDGRIIASTQPLDACRLMQRLWASLADTPHDCLDR